MKASIPALKEDCFNTLNRGKCSIILQVFLLGMIAFGTVFGGAGNAAAQSVLIPNFWDPNERFVKPDLSSRQRLKFLTTTDFPPFNFIDRKKRLSGFHIDLARAICEELDMLAKCQIQALPWDELEKAIEKGEGDAIIAGLGDQRRNAGRSTVFATLSADSRPVCARTLCR